MAAAGARSQQYERVVVTDETDGLPLWRGLCGRHAEGSRHREDANDSCNVFDNCSAC
jgi:hypothetical protein